MRLLRKNAYHFLLAGIFLIFCAGCSNAPSVKNEEEIQADIVSSNCYTENYSNFSILELEIAKRQTDIENKTDTVYVTLTVENEDSSIQGYIDMNLTYGLYNEGWMLDECVIDYERENEGAIFTPLKGMDLSVDAITELIPALRGAAWSEVSIEENNLYLEDGFETYDITGIETHKYVTFSYSATLSCPFLNKEGRWGMPNLIIFSCDEDWHIAGEYYCSKVYNKSIDFSIVILDDAPIDNIDIQHKVWYDGTGSYYEYYNEGTLMYEASCISFDSFVSSVLQTWGSQKSFVALYRYIEEYNFDVVMTGDFDSLDPFMYVTYWDHRGQGFTDGALYIGADVIAYSCNEDLVLDEYNRRIPFDVWELIPY